MAWTTPKTFAALAQLTAAELNTYLSDNTADLHARAWHHLLGSVGDVDPGETVYGGFGGTSGLTAGDGDVPMTAAGTIGRLFVRCSSAPGSSQSFVVTMRRNGSDQALAVTITNTDQEGSDTSNTFSVVAGDRVEVKVVATGGTPNNVVVNVSVQFTPS